MFSNSFNLAQLRPGLRPFRLHWYPRLGSTNTQAAKLRRQRKLFAPAIVLTGRQLAGRGRGNNSWWSLPGCLTATFALPVRDHLAPHQVPLLAGLAIRDVLAELSGINDIQLKWPNDLLYQDRKLGGLLCERLDHLDLIGLGLNVNLAALAGCPLRRAWENLGVSCSAIAYSRSAIFAQAKPNGGESAARQERRSPRKGE